MSGFRYWLADLISGGWVTKHESMTLATIEINFRYLSALHRISAEVKPTSNATVRRMGRIAEDALK